MSDGTRGPEPGDLGKTQKTISFDFEDLSEYQRMVGEGTIDMGFPAFVRQSFRHELARYRATMRTNRRTKK